MNKNNQKGFTLVELSIVLVIIGLLIGGILAAQSMINTTKIQSFTRQISQFDAAVANFNDKYTGLPGDNSRISSDGDNDGVVEGTATTTFTDEMDDFWPALSISGLKAEEAPTAGYSATLSYSNLFPFGAPNAPRSKVGSLAGIIAIGDSTAAIFSTAGITVPMNMYIVADCTPMTTTTAACRNGINGADAIAIDSKLDDGIGTTGQVVGMIADTSGGNLADFASITDGTEAAYVAGTTVSTTVGNILAIRIGTQTGTPR